MTTGLVALVVGAGMVGSATAARLHAEGAVVTCADRDRGRAARVADRIGCAHTWLDLDDWASTRAAVTGAGADLVVHAAGQLQAGGAPEQHRRLIADAGGQAYTLARATVDGGAGTLLLVSSLGVYSGHIAGGNGAVAVPETLAPWPVSTYGAAKAAAEAAVLAACAGARTRVLIARLCGVYGGPADGQGRLNRALLRLVADHLAGRTVRVPPSLGGREYLHVADAAAGLVALVGADRTAQPMIVNIGTGMPLGTAQVAEAFAGLGSAVEPGPEPSGQWWHLDVGLAARLGFRPQLSLADGLRRWVDELAAAVRSERSEG